MKNRELKNIIRKALQEQGGGPSSGPFYRVDAGGCIECPAGAGPPQCEFMDKNCTVHYSSNYSGGVGHPGEDDPNMSGGSTSQSGNNTSGVGAGGHSSFECQPGVTLGQYSGCIPIQGLGGTFTTEQECMNSGCGGGPRPGGSKGRNRKAPAVNELIKNIKKLLNK
tara:strand:+ start:1626 stop:2123 length:498 start_codon:yes stop_codon:yes gene_type:complete